MKKTPVKKAAKKKPAKKANKANTCSACSCCLEVEVIPNESAKNWVRRVSLPPVNTKESVQASIEPFISALSSVTSKKDTLGLVFDLIRTRHMRGIANTEAEMRGIFDELGLKIVKKSEEGKSE